MLAGSLMGMWVVDGKERQEGTKEEAVKSTALTRGPWKAMLALTWWRSGDRSVSFVADAKAGAVGVGGEWGITINRAFS